MSGSTINCGWSSENLLAGYREELSDLETVDLNTHLDSCADCRAENDGIIRLQDAIASMPELEPAEASWVTITKRIQENDLPAGQPSRGVAFLCGGALLAAAIAFFLFLLPTSTPSPLTVLAGEITMDGIAANGEVSPVEGSVVEATTIALLSVATPRTAEITLARGTRLAALGPGHWRMDAGRALFEIDPGSGEFVVDTAFGRVEVEGTSFDVDLTSGSLVLAVLRGVVTLTTGDETLRVHSGKGVTVTPTGTSSARYPVDPQQICRWNRAPNASLVHTLGLLEFTLVNRTARPLAIKPFDPAVGVYSLRIEGPYGTEDLKLQAAMLAEEPKATPGRPSLTLKPGDDYRLAIDPLRLELSTGDYNVSVVYTPYTKDLPEGAWRGVLISPPVRLSVP